MSELIRFTKKGIYCPQGDFYLDPWQPVKKAVISHGHADHARRGMGKYLCHTLTQNIIKRRLGEDIVTSTLGYNDPIFVNGVRVSLHPAGHVIGSAQIRLEYKGKVAVFTGDYKVKSDGITEEFEALKCHEFITESTFGLPIYNWQEEHQLKEQLSHWVLGNIANDKTSVLFAYSLGKAQRIMNLLDGVAEIYVHAAIQNMNEAIMAAGKKLPHTQVVNLETDKKIIQNKIVILPPGLIESKLLKKIPNAATAICSGWMHVRGNRRWRNVDAGFAVSDHADWQGLLSAVQYTEAEKVYVTHGYQSTFSRYLCELGIDAQELKTEYGEEEVALASTDIES